MASCECFATAVVQAAIRREAARCGTTLLVVAHRLSTVVDFDAVMVLDKGLMVEFGPAKELMSLPGGVFRSMVHESSDRVALETTMLR